MKKTRSDRIFDAINNVFMVVMLVIMLYPLYYTVIASISEPAAVARGQVMFWPVGFTLESYKNVFENASIWIGYRNSLIYTALGTGFSLILTLTSAYALSKKYLPMRNFFSWYYLFTMYFSGGLVPTYLLVKQLGLVNKPYTLIILGGLSIYNMIVSRTYFQTSIPEELYEAASIDGASEFRRFFSVALPLAKPIIAVIGLYYAVGRWNEYYNSLIYLSDSDLMPLQMKLREILIQNQSLIMQVQQGSVTIDDEALAEITRRAYVAQTMKYALIFIASAPLLCLYPFVQKYFVKGIMIGSLKG